MTEASSLYKSSSNLENGESEKAPFNSGLLNDERAIASFVLSLQSRGRSKNTIRTYSDSLEYLRRFARERGMPSLLGLSTEHIRAFLGNLFEKGNKPGSVHHHWASLSSFYGWASAEGELPGKSPMERVKPPHVPEKLLPHYSEEDLTRVLGNLPEKSSDESVLRDRAIILTLFDSGLRAAELCSLTTHDLNLRDGTIRVVGKGEKEREVGIGPMTAIAIDRWLRRRRASEAASLFCSKSGDALNNSGLRMLLMRRFKAAGVEFRGAHAFRRGFGIAFLNNGGDPNDLRTLAGWSSFEMLRHYTRATETQRALKAHKAFAPSDRLKK